MKITKQYLKQVIKEELEKVTSEGKEVPSLSELIDSVRAFFNRGESFGTSSYDDTLQWYLSTSSIYKETSPEIRNLLDKAEQLLPKVKKVSAPEIGPRATKVADTPETKTILQQASKLFDQAKNLAIAAEKKSREESQLTY